MKHAKRMVLVPEDALNRQRQRLETSPLIANMMHQDTELSNILQRTDLDDSEKHKLYNANMERYLELKHQKDKQTSLVRPKGQEGLDDATVVQHIPRTMRPRAMALLNRLKAKPDVITWDKSGQVVVDGEEIPDSNM